jgi:hypothetical protein
MILYHDGIDFKVLDTTVHLYTEKFDYGYNTVAEVGDKLHYLGNEIDNITTAIFAWEDLHGRSLTPKELRQVLTDNQIL